MITYLHPFNGLVYWTTWVSRYQKDKISLDLNEARDNCVLGNTGISWTICKQSAPQSRQIATPTPHQSIFTGQMLLTPNRVTALTHTRTHARTHGRTHARTHARAFNGPSSGPGWAGTRQVKPICILLKQEKVSGSGISWAICKSASRSRQTTTPAPHHSISFFTGRMPFLPPNQQR